MLVDRVLALTDDADRSGQAALVRAFQLFLLLHVTVRVWLWSLGDRANPAFAFALAGALTFALLLGLSRRWARAAAALAAAALAVKFVATFPAVSNHFFIEWLCIALLAAMNVAEPDERALFLQTARWVTVIVLFSTGLQKVLYGTYFDAQYLGFAMTDKASFVPVLQPLVPAGELARLLAIDHHGLGAGPFAVEAPLLVALANAVCLFELAAPVALVVRRTRPWAVLATALFTIAIQLGARELMFGALFINLLLLFLAWPLNRRLLPAFALLFAALLGVKLGLLRAVQFN